MTAGGPSRYVPASRGPARSRRLFGCEVHDIAGGKDRLVRKLAENLGERLPTLLRELGRDDLRAACRRHGLDDSARARAELQASILEAAGLDPRAATVPPVDTRGDRLPTKGQVVHARHRQWLVERVDEGAAGESPIVRLVCLDDDDPGRRLTASTRSASSSTALARSSRARTSRSGGRSGTSKSEC